ncbi:hypothetical protein H6P81_013478 [Aristolochia fimbriata]|uniref:Uncharacterized protein n=1 Tax=Aristolochia fimbriata TaxID=158543 RepID=A0AAV7EEU9_ARIFI|nr:hypothetical protein H6P81_013478 [Aristolochia fimbriata]
MTLLCFLLDLPSIPPPLLRDLKQCLMQLANLYAISYGGDERKSTPLQDRIGLCYFQKNKNSSSDELKLAYIPRGNFSLRDFHRAVTNLPTDGFSVDSIELRENRSEDLEKNLSRLLSKELLYSWGFKDILRKVIFTCSCLPRIVDPIRKILMEAAEQCVSLEFLMLAQEVYDDMSDNMKEFSNSISEHDNCLLGRCFPGDTWALAGLVKRWVQEVKDEVEDTRQVTFIFKRKLFGCTNQLRCSLFSFTNQIADGFDSCQACRCHGKPTKGSKEEKCDTSCPITDHKLGESDLVDNAVRVGEHTLLLLPSFQSCGKLRSVASPINFTILERTNLASLSEAVIVGNSYTVTPMQCHEMEAASDDNSNPELNVQIFHGLSRALHSMDQGLVCSSNCNIETMKEATFQCFYILLPSEKGPMLLRRVAGAEEILLVPDSTGMDCSVSKEIQDSIQASLTQMEVREFNPLLHERGFHTKLNCLVKESLHFRSIPNSPKAEKNQPAPIQPLLMSESFSKENSELSQTTEADREGAKVAKEWEQLIVHEIRVSVLPMSPSIPSVGHSLLTSDSKPLDERTSRILERLEPPKKPKSGRHSPSILTNARKEVSGPIKKPLVPFEPNRGTDQGMSFSQPMKPTFQKLKRKLK